MSKIKNGGLDHYGTGSSEKQQFGRAGIEWVNYTLQRLCWCAGEIRDVPLIMYVPLLTPCLDSEKLCISVDLMKGTFLVSLAQKGLIYICHLYHLI